MGNISLKRIGVAMLEVPPPSVKWHKILVSLKGKILGRATYIMCLDQGFRTSALMTFWARSFSVFQAYVCIVGCLAVSPASPIDAIAPERQWWWSKTSLGIPNVPWRTELPLVENHWTRLHCLWKLLCSCMWGVCVYVISESYCAHVCGVCVCVLKQLPAYRPGKWGDISWLHDSWLKDFEKLVVGLEHQSSLCFLFCSAPLASSPIPMCYSSLHSDIQNHTLGGTGAVWSIDDTGGSWGQKKRDCRARLSDDRQWFSLMWGLSVTLGKFLTGDILWGQRWRLGLHSRASCGNWGPGEEFNFTFCWIISPWVIETVKSKVNTKRSQ